MTSDNPSVLRRGYVLLYCVLGILAIAALAVIGREWAGSDRADLAQWVMAGASVVTLFAAVVAAVFAAGAFNLETAREERYRQDQRRYQAERVAAWFAYIDVQGAYKRRTRGFMVRNASDLPVTNVNLYLFFDGNPVAMQSVTVAPPADEPVHHRLDSLVGDALDRARERFTEIHGDEVLVPSATVDITFTDAAGQRWHRKATGELTEE
ncbi:hypothetical protein F9L07_04150 [Pimelobacter simplex]|uniref:Uncharacterized protein n=1 Tax=Nocardioides simplex TaxID=2045 RepID=A0A7J5DZP2_NOCSI|nr:hypothetical protein [Pimelobacter simplex]KAB2811124.1 hypothetical protein F9L07_04150 [Pimelobacter simplex]